MNKKFILSFWSFLLLFLIPVFGFITSFLSLRADKKNKGIYFLMALFYFFFMIRYPPFSDSYSRYLQYQNINDIAGVFSSGNDVLFYLSAFVAKKINIDFFYIPAFYSFLMVYFSLNAFGIVIDKETCNKSENKLILAHIIFISMLNILNWAGGIRYGMAMIWMVSGVVYCIYNSKKVGYLLIGMSIFMHFSMLFFLPVIVLNGIYKIKNKKTILLFCILFYFVSTSILPLILSNISFWGISEHSEIYVDGMYARQNSNANALILSVLSYLFFGYMLLSFVLDKKHKYKFDNFTGLCSMAIFLSASSITGFGRFIALCDFFLLIRLLLTFMDEREQKLSLNNLFLIFYFFVNLFLFDIYLQRDQIFLAEMWQGLYKSPISLIDYSQSDYNQYLYQINSDGTWIRHERDKY
ncbi:EpsG family protein [Klebsiella pneumoniae]|uniref:EpsG family protein n=1 Tax=Klebsiella pneumoniae TaxID=573 RepID=UPI0009833C86|nr:EpsG family protein [Klebsiella pneumoniae]HCM6844988.1 EpsG family protein [Klebsiella quasipneumoniae]MCL7658739.1 EpsG family protein [Klebsiella pneumoniae]MCQ0636503.1 EpsG family protein [Klebsiella pneumoniae]MDG0249893.1 EpsG family protein [Klebsiella pneumoniae]PLD45180.1 hypothetical protein B6I55_19095 [Klebsiella pneumoniae]